MTIETLGIDIAKNVFNSTVSITRPCRSEAAGDARPAPCVLRVDPCTVVVEACTGSILLGA